MQTFSYIDTSGKKQTVQAVDSATAIKSASNIAPTSGVMLEQNTPQVIPPFQDTSAIRKQDQQNRAELEVIDTNINTQNQMKDPYAGVNDKVSEIEDSYAREWSNTVNGFQKLQAQMDSTSSALIQNIRDTFANRIKEMQVTNQKQLQFQESLGLRESTGRARYAPLMQQQILTDEEQRGVLRISQLETQMYDLIIQAQQAKDGNDFKMLQMTMDAYKENYNNMQGAIKDLYTNIKTQEELRLKQMREERDAEVAAFKFQQDKAKAVAPSLRQYLDQIPTQAGKSEFMAKYAQQMGIDEDILWGTYEEEALGYKKTMLDIQGKQQSISNAARSNARAEEKHSRDMAKKDTWEFDVENIMSGTYGINDVSNANKSRVTAELRRYGFTEERAPEWFIEYQTDKKTDAGQGKTVTGNEIQEEWNALRVNSGFLTK